YPAAYKVDAREFELGPYEYIEFKYHLAKDATMLFAWSASGNVIQDFHGDPDGTVNQSQSYNKASRLKADGSFTAPFSGIHGWVWENPGGDTIKVTLTTAGFYTTAHEFDLHHRHTVLEVQNPDTIQISKK